MPNTRPTISDLATWGLSSQTADLLSQHPEILTDLAQARRLPPLPPGYHPAVIDVLFDDVPYLRTEQGVMTVVRECLSDYQPRFIEYRVDDETAFFQVGHEVIVNRLDGIAQMMGRGTACHS